MRFVGVDLNAEYVEIAKSRIEHALTARTELEGE
jgi:DNA modification methylase